MPSSVDCITATSVSEFSVHTAGTARLRQQSGAFRKTYARREQTCLRAREMARLTQMYGPAVRCKRTSSELADVRSCINVSGL
jgi:hypothetical protein